SSTKETRFNASTPKVGRLRLNRAEQRAKAHSVLKEYNQGLRMKALFCESDKTLWVWQQVCSEGYQCSSWVSSVVAPVVDEKGDAGSVIEEFLTSWPLFFYQALDLTYNLQNCFDADVEPCSTKEQYEPSLCTVKVGLSET
ncbi:hypothetical protein JG687_00014930, partial [Phytophthora cactorum]